MAKPIIIPTTKWGQRNGNHIILKDEHTGRYSRYNDEGILTTSTLISFEDATKGDTFIPQEILDKEAAAAAEALRVAEAEERAAEIAESEAKAAELLLGIPQNVGADAGELVA
jgi:hypothetical protein